MIKVGEGYYMVIHQSVREVRSAVTILRRCPRCVIERLFLSWLLIVFIEENDDSHIYVEGNIVSKSIPTALVILNRACGTMLIQTPTSLCCAYSKSDVAISKTSIWRAVNRRHQCFGFCGRLAISLNTERLFQEEEDDTWEFRGAFKLFLEVFCQTCHKIFHRWMFLHVMLFTMLLQTSKLQISSMNVSLQKVQLWLESSNCRTYQQQCVFCPVVADLGDFRWDLMSHKKYICHHLLVAYKAQRFLGWFALQIGQKWYKLIMQVTHPLQHTAFAQPANIIVQQKILVFSWHILQQCSEKTMLQTRALTNKVNKSCHCIHHLLHFSTQFSAQRCFVNDAVKCGGLTAESLLTRPSRCPTIDGAPSFTTDAILLKSKPFPSRNCVNSLKTISPDVHPGRGSKQSSSSRNVFTSKNLTNTASCSILVRSQDESMAGDMASAFFKLVNRQEKHSYSSGCRVSRQWHLL